MTDRHDVATLVARDRATARTARRDLAGYWVTAASGGWALAVVHGPEADLELVLVD